MIGLPRRGPRRGRWQRARAARKLARVALLAFFGSYVVVDLALQIITGRFTLHAGQVVMMVLVVLLGQTVGRVKPGPIDSEALAGWRRIEGLPR